MFKHNGVHQCMWSILWSCHLSSGCMSWTLGCREGLGCQLITTWWWVGSAGRGRSLADPNILWGSAGNIWWNPLLGRSSTPTSRRALTRSWGRLGTLSPNGPCSQLPLLTRLFEAVSVKSPVPVVAAIQGTGDGGDPHWVPQISGCCEAVLADMSLQHRMAVGDSASGLADRGGGPSIRKGGP